MMNSMTTDTAVSLASTMSEDDLGTLPLKAQEKLSVFRMIGISCALLGYQLAYSANFSLITPIMSRLGFSATVRPIVWWVAPITDLIVQPIVAFYSDQLHAKLGRRRPFILAGGLGTSFGLLLILFCEKMGEIFSESNKLIISQVIFVFAFIINNIALNVLQGPARSLVGDLVPVHQQIVGNTIATIMNGLGAIIVNLIGGLHLSDYASITNEQLILILSMSAVVVAVLMTIFTAHEVRYIGPKSDKSMLGEIYTSFRYAPKEVYRAAACFSLSWCGFFMFLQETTDFFGRMIFDGCPSEIAGCSYQRYQDGVNFGMLTIAGMYSVSLVYGFIQPFLINKLGAKVCYALSQFLEVTVLIVFNFINNKWALFGMFSILGMSFMAFNSIPFAIVAMSVPEEDMGKNMAVVNSCGCIGQQTANLIIGSGISAIFPDYYNLQIACGSVFALLSGILTIRLIIPSSQPERVLINKQSLLQGDQ